METRHVGAGWFVVSCEVFENLKRRMEMKRLVAAVILLVFFCGGGIAFAAGIGEEFVINEGSAPVTEFDPVNNRFFVVYSSGGMIKGIFFDSSGKIGSEVVIASDVLCCGRAFLALARGSSNFLVVFIKWNDESYFDIWGQLVDLNGVLTGSEFQISKADGYQWYSSVVFDSNEGVFFVVWRDQRTGYEVYAQKVKSDGSLEGEEIPISVGAYSYAPPAVGVDSKGNFLVAFYEGGLSGKIVNSNGPGTSFNIIPSIACCLNSGPGSVVFNKTTGNFMVAWSAWDTDGSQRILGQRVMPSGGLVGEGFRVSNTLVDFGSVAGASSGNSIYFFWEDGWLSRSGVRLRGVESDGSTPIPESPISIDPNWTKKSPGIAAAGDRLLLVWEEETMIYGMILIGLPIRPSVSLELNGSVFSQGEQLVLKAKIFTPPNAPMGGGKWKLKTVLWTETPAGAKVSLLGEKEFSFPPGMEQEVPLLNMAVPQIPAGEYFLKTRFIDPLTLEEWSHGRVNFEVR